MCFEMDEAIWPDHEKTVRIKDAGSPHEITYKPSKDIRGDYTVDVSYGAVAGMDPNRGLVFLLQGLAAGVLSKETVQRHLPVDIDPAAEALKIDLEHMDMALGAAIDAIPQALPMMVSQGVPVEQIVQQFVGLREERQKGRSLAEAAKKILVPKEKPGEPPAAPAAPPGMPGQPPSPAEDLLTSLAGMTASGRPNLQSNVQRTTPI
jgi:hypothetical protein